VSLLSSQAGPWIALVALGVYHGINPAMGWLFAVALGLQRGGRRGRRTVIRSLLPIAVGHEASIAVAVFLVSVAELVTAPDVLRPVAAVLLIAFGSYKLLKPRAHPRWVGMRLGLWDLVLWSFLMSTAHGAGLMLFPVLLGLAGTPAAASGAAGDAGVTTVHVHGPGEVHLHLASGTPLGLALAQDGAAVLLHSTATFLTMGVVAILVYEKLGLTVLRRAWVNFDTVWAVAVCVAGVFTLFTA
jgi:hypothetical protein